MKKYKTIIIFTISILAFFGLCYMISENLNRVPSVEEWFNETKKDEYVVTVIGSATCNHCMEYKPVINKLSKKNKFKLYFFVKEKMEEEEYSKLISSYEELVHEYVPFTAIIKNGKVINTVTGFESESKTIEYLKEQGVIKN